MGCDGGTIPKRHELVRTAKKPEQKDKDMDRNAKWNTCVISQQSLTTPLMSCELGHLYSKESVIEFLLDRTISENASHLRSLKDVKEMKLTKNPGYKKPHNGLADQYYDTQAAKYVCPIVGLEMNGKYKFCLLWSCSCVLSERALKEVESDTCHNCGEKFEKDDVIILNAEGDDLKLMEENMIKRREKAKALRKEKKDKKNGKRKVSGEVLKTENSFKSPAAPTNGVSNNDAKKSKKELKKDATKRDLGRVASSSKKVDEKEIKKIDHTKSKVYQNLFTSSDKNKSRDKAHWVTYNPYHL